MDPEIGFDSYISAIWRWKWPIIAVAIVAGAAVFAYRSRQPASYTAEALVEPGKVWRDPIEDPYVTSAAINSNGFLRALAARMKIKPAHLKHTVSASALAAGPARSSYPILVRITATAGTADEAVALATEVAGDAVARHDAVFDQAMKPHLEYQARLEQMLSSLKTQSADPPGASQPRTDSIIKLEQELDQVTAANTSPTISRRTALVGPVAQSGSAKPDTWRPAALAALFTALIAAAAVLVLIPLFQASREHARKPPIIPGKDSQDVAAR